ncbi:hypothetical protein ACGFZC_16355 [[Kitasatospora] papulosa]|uniref:hypothetical protein n=1 Tax=[Kitasatospora] papulosa TaxID=1464011 RepID=UPI00371EBAA1
MTEKIRVTVVTEYTPKLEYYPGDTVEEAMRFDVQENHFVEYPTAYLDDPSELVSVTYEVVPAE